MPPEENMSPEEWKVFVAETDAWRKKFLSGSVYDSQKKLACLAGTVLDADEIIIGKKRSGEIVKPHILAFTGLKRTLPPTT